MLYLVDADTLCYASAAMAENENAGIAKYNADNSIDYLLHTLNDPEYKLFVTGEGNFREKIYPEYKANRLKTQRPRWLQHVKDYLIAEYGAVCSQGCEADDLLGVEQMASSKAGIETCISSIDKDLDQIPGWHYSPEIKRLGKVVKEARRYLVSPLDGLRFFYYQLLVGDATDNVKGVVGIGPKGAAQLLDGLTEERDMFERVLDAYGSTEELEMNGKVLWIWQEDNGIWQLPNYQGNVDE